RPTARHSALSPPFDVPAARRPSPLPSFPTRRSSDLPHFARRGVVARPHRAPRPRVRHPCVARLSNPRRRLHTRAGLRAEQHMDADRKSTRLNSSHVSISYAVFCLKKKKLISERPCTL